ncbi:MAG: CHAD domain-containing protein [Campylobacterota bacterium]
MSFSISVDKSVAKQLQKVVNSQTKKALKESRCEEIGADKAVHKIRKRCKKLRGLLRLIKPSLKEKALYKEQNDFFKKIANELSGARDDKVLGDTFAKIVKRYNLDMQKFEGIYSELNAIKQEHNDTQQIMQQLENVAGQLQDNLSQLHRYKLKKSGTKALHKGLKKTYTKARTKMDIAKNAPVDENFHEWRKWCKYHWYQMQLVQTNSDCLLQARINRLKLLSDILGDEHDITVFKQYLQNVSLPYEEEFVSYLDRQQHYLRSVAFEIGEELFCAKPKKFVTYLEAIFAL